LKAGKRCNHFHAEPPDHGQSRVIAKGERIRDVYRLVARYGGRRSKWVKKSSLPFEIAGEKFEYLGMSILE